MLLSGAAIAEYTARDAAHARFAEASTGESRSRLLYFIGPTPARPGHVIGFAGPTTASRMDPFPPLLIERDLRGMIGKGRRSAEVRQSMLERGCVYFGAVEGTAALLAQRILESEVIAYDDLGTEAIHRVRLQDIPAVVVNDLHGDDLYEQGPLRWERG